jgi:hypothetical protein
VAACGVTKPDVPPPLRWMHVESSSPTWWPPLRLVVVESPRPTRLPAPPPTLSHPTPRLHAVPSRESPPSSRATAPASAGSRVGLPTAVYHRSHRRCRPTSRPMETPAVMCRHCSSQPWLLQLSGTVAATEQVPQTLAATAERVAQTLAAAEPVKLLLPTTKALVPYVSTVSL